MAAQDLAQRTGLNVVVETSWARRDALQMVARSKASDGYLITAPGPLIHLTLQLAIDSRRRSC